MKETDMLTLDEMYLHNLQAVDDTEYGTDQQTVEVVYMTEQELLDDIKSMTKQERIAWSESPSQPYIPQDNSNIPAGYNENKL